MKGIPDIRESKEIQEQLRKSKEIWRKEIEVSIFIKLKYQKKPK